MILDAHAHLDLYEDRLASALVELQSGPIFTISVSMDPPSYARAQAIARECDLVLPCFGIHPWRAPDHAGELWRLRRPIERTPMLGEIGLDFHFVTESGQYPAQRLVFEHFLAAARDQGKVVNLHTKGAERDVLEGLDRYGIMRAIVHWYSGPLDIFDAYVARGTYFTVGVEVLHSEHIRRIARRIPTDQLLTETDNPGGLKHLTGEVGMPRALRDVIEALARLRNASVEEIIQTVHRNFSQLIRNDPWMRATYERHFRTTEDDS